MRPHHTKTEACKSNRTTSWHNINNKKTQIKQEKIRKTKHREQFKQTGVNFCNLHQVQTVNQNRSETVNNVRIAHANARSIKNKDDLVAEYIDSTKIDFTIITETWLQDNETNQGWCQQPLLITKTKK